MRGVVQGVGFRPFVYRLAHQHGVSGWVFNGEEGVTIHAEAPEVTYLQVFIDATEDAGSSGCCDLGNRGSACRNQRRIRLRDSSRASDGNRPTVRISPDLPVCEDCLQELFDPADPRYLYPYINCTNCGPRYSVILALPYDRPNTTMKPWPLDAYCDAEYHDPANRRFHAQPVACPQCGPHYFLKDAHESSDDENAIAANRATSSRRDRSSP